MLGLKLGMKEFVKEDNKRGSEYGAWGVFGVIF